MFVNNASSTVPHVRTIAFRTEGDTSTDVIPRYLDQLSSVSASLVGWSYPPRQEQNLATSG